MQREGAEAPSSDAEIERVWGTRMHGSVGVGVKLPNSPALMVVNTSAKAVIETSRIKGRWRTHSHGETNKVVSSDLDNKPALGLTGDGERV